MSTVFHKTPPSWMKHAEGMAAGSSRRIGDSFKLSFNGFSYQLYDFRDKSHEVYTPTLTLAERLELLKQKQEAEREVLASTKLPNDCMHHPRDWPADARLWFYDSRMNDDDIHNWGYCWSPKLQRVIMPFNLLDGRRLYVARDPWWSRESRSPKYLRPAGQPGAGVVLGDSRNLIVITEDLLSAQRITDVTGVTTIPLMGTSLSRTDALAISKLGNNLLLWLDPDAAGGSGQRAVRKVLNSFDLTIQGFDRFGSIDAVDPKKLPDAVLLQVVGRALYDE